MFPNKLILQFVLILGITYGATGLVDKIIEAGKSTGLVDKIIEGGKSLVGYAKGHSAQIYFAVNAVYVVNQVIPFTCDSEWGEKNPQARCFRSLEDRDSFCNCIRAGKFDFDSWVPFSRCYCCKV